MPKLRRRTISVVGTRNQWGRNVGPVKEVLDVDDVLREGKLAVSAEGSDKATPGLRDKDVSGLMGVLIAD